MDPTVEDSAYTVLLVIYRLTFHPLAKFPGPKFAAATKWYEFYYDCIKGGGGLFAYEIDRMHERYGPVVRINPHEIHVSDPTWLDTLYPGPGPVRDKYAPSAHMSGVPEGRRVGKKLDDCVPVMTERKLAAFGTVDHYIHRQRRSAVKMFVSKKTVKTFQNSICNTVEALCRELTRFATSGETFEISTYFLSWATDSVAKYLENDTYGLLDDGQRRKDWQSTIDKVVELTPVVKQFPFFMPFVLKVPNWFMRIVSPDTNRVLLMHKRMRSTARRYLSLHLAAEKTDPQTPTDELSRDKVDAYRAILNSNLPDYEKQPDRVAQEVLTLLVGGSATTMRVMSRVLFHFTSTPHVMSRLRSTLDAIMPMPTVRPELEVLQRQDYLTPVSMSPSRILMDPTIYNNPYEFQPERWLGPPAQQAHLMRFFVPFGRGVRMCVGQKFEFELCDVDRVRDVDAKRDCFLGQPSKESRGVRVKVRERSG
ncbi:MAG: hypothetical protein Q9217_002365 [Psora testacea]